RHPYGEDRSELPVRPDRLLITPIAPTGCRIKCRRGLCVPGWSARPAARLGPMCARTGRRIRTGAVVSLESLRPAIPDLHQAPLCIASPILQLFPWPEANLCHSVHVT